MRDDSDSGTTDENPRALLLRAGTGDTEAFHRFYISTVDDVSRYVASRADAGSTEDIVAETYLRAYRSAASFTDRGTPAIAWLITIARNQIATHYRRSSRQVRPNADERTVPSTEERSVLSDEHAAVLRDLQQLSPRYQEILRLRFIEDLPVAVCADELEIGEGAVRALTFRALNALRSVTAVDLEQEAEEG